MYLALNNLQRLICHKIQTNKSGHCHFKMSCDALKTAFDVLYFNSFLGKTFP